MKNCRLFLIFAAALVLIPACTEENSVNQVEDPIFMVLPDTANQASGQADYYSGFANMLDQPHLVTVSSSDPLRASVIFSAENAATVEFPAMVPPQTKLVSVRCLPTDQANSKEITISFKQQAASGLGSGQVITHNILCPGKTPAAAVTAKPLTISKKRSEQITISIDAAPSSPVSFNITSEKGIAAADPATITFTAENYAAPQTVTINAQNIPNTAAPISDTIKFAVATTDPAFQNIKLSDIPVKVLNSSNGSGEAFTLRVMTANITSGEHQSYDPGHGIRIFQAVKPDIVMIQEFKYKYNNPSDMREMVDKAFGTEFNYVQGRINGNDWIPNGIISRYPIIDSGYWKSNVIHNRDWNWALVDIPGNKELLVVSVHLSTDDNRKEVPSLAAKIRQKIAADTANNIRYYVMVGGDFNSPSSADGKTELDDVVYTRIRSRLPCDQEHNNTTNATRTKTLDLLYVDEIMHNKEVPVVIGRHSYEFGHVFDSRIYADFKELDDVPPVEAKDSAAKNMQHMAVIREFKLVGE